MALTPTERKLRRLLRLCLDKMASDYSNPQCDCCYGPHFKGCKRIDLIETIRKQAGLARWPTYLRGHYRNRKENPRG